MRRLLKIFHGKIHASKEPSCSPMIAPRGPTTLNGREGMASRTILSGTVFSKGKFARDGDGAFCSALHGAATVRLSSNSVATARKTAFIHSPQKMCQPQRNQREAFADGI